MPMNILPPKLIVWIGCAEIVTWQLGIVISLIASEYLPSVTGTCTLVEIMTVTVEPGVPWPE